MLSELKRVFSNRHAPAVALAAVLLFGAVKIGFLALISPEAGRWLIRTGLDPALLLPCLGLGLGIDAATRIRASGAIAPLFPALTSGGWFAGLALGFLASGVVLALPGLIPGAARHHYLLRPLMALATGAALLPPLRLTRWLLPLAALICGAGYGAHVQLTVPAGDHVWQVDMIAVLLALWMPTLGGALTSTLPPRARGASAHIAGAWLLALGALTGGLTLWGPELPPPGTLPTEDPAPLATPAAPTLAQLTGLPETLPQTLPQTMPGLSRQTAAQASGDAQP